MPLCKYRRGTLYQESLPFLAYLEKDCIRRDHMMGKNLAMLTIMEFSILEAWKKQMQSQRSLSLPLLSSRASRLERRLNNGLKAVLDGFDAMPKFEQESSLVTK